MASFGVFVIKDPPGLEPRFFTFPTKCDSIEVRCISD
jgi:hypothetical protein